MIDQILTLLPSLLPAVLVGILAWYFFRKFTENEDRRRAFQLKKDSQREITPVRLQAYERMALFMERIHPVNLLPRLGNNETDKMEYARRIIGNINGEYEHNLAQQIYMSQALWNMIKTAKAETIAMVMGLAKSEDITNGDELRVAILEQVSENSSPLNDAMIFLKQEVVKEF